MKQFEIQRKRRLLRRVFIYLGLVLILGSLMGLMLMKGSQHYTFNEVWQVLLGTSVNGARFAVMTIRLPRMLAGVLTGLAFGIAGSTFQALLRNPLASPDIIGVTAGTTTSAVFLILVLNLSGNVVSFVSVIFGLLIAGLIYILAKSSQFSSGRLILVGIGVKAFLGALINYMLLGANQYDVPAAMQWLSGSLNGIQLDELSRLALVVGVFGFLILIFTKSLDVMVLGDALACTLGISLKRTRWVMLISAVCLIAFATAVTGPIAFVAFLSGPIIRMLMPDGNVHSLGSGIVGAILVLGGDLIGQFAFGIKLPVGVITGIIGAPYLLLLLMRMSCTD